jgi:two-component system, OmpR family, sensor histidine kinase VicK
MLTPLLNFRTDYNIERTLVFNGAEDTTKAILHAFYAAKGTWDVCGDSTAPSVAMGVREFKRAYYDFQQRGVKIRWITQITKDNLSYCKELMQFGTEIRHLDKIKGSFAVSESEYVATATLKEAEPVPQLIYSNVKEIVEQQKYVFENFWDKAIPSEQRIMEIIDGKKVEFFHIISDNKDASEIYCDLAQSVKKEALLILPSSKALIIAEKLGVLDCLIKASQHNDNIDDINRHTESAQVKIICPIDEKNDNIVNWIYDNAPNIQILNGDNSSSTIFITDNKKFLKAEHKDKDAEEFSNSIGFVVYSNSMTSVTSFKTFFELLWNVHIINKQSEEQKARSQLLTDILAHDINNYNQIANSNLGLILQSQKPINDNNQIMQYLQIAKQAITRSSNLIKSVKLLERINHNVEEIRMNLYPIDIIDSLNRCINLTQSMVTDKKVIVSISNTLEKKSNDDTSSKKMTLLVSANELLDEVFINLLTNAARYTDSYESRIDILIDTYSNGNTNKSKMLKIDFIDNAHGIPDELKKQIFDRYKITSKNSGLGLSIVRMLMDVYGGHVSVEDKITGDYNKGSRFTLFLPLANP